MFTLVNGNVERVVATEAEKEVLIKKGFEEVIQKPTKTQVKKSVNKHG